MIDQGEYAAMTQIFQACIGPNGKLVHLRRVIMRPGAGDDDGLTICKRTAFFRDYKGSLATGHLCKSCGNVAVMQMDTTLVDWVRQDGADFYRVYGEIDGERVPDHKLATWPNGVVTDDETAYRARAWFAVLFPHCAIEPALTAETIGVREIV